MTETNKKTQVINLSDPSAVERVRSDKYDDFYANIVRAEAGNWDVRLEFQHAFGLKANKFLIKEQCTVTLSFENATKLKNVLDTLIDTQNPKFKIHGEEPDSLRHSE